MSNQQLYYIPPIHVIGVISNRCLNLDKKYSISYKGIPTHFDERVISFKCHTLHEVISTINEYEFEEININVRHD